MQLYGDFLQLFMTNLKRYHLFSEDCLANCPRRYVTYNKDFTVVFVRSMSARCFAPSAVIPHVAILQHKVHKYAASNVYTKTHHT